MSLFPLSLPSDRLHTFDWSLHCRSFRGLRHELALRALGHEEKEEEIGTYSRGVSVSVCVSVCLSKYNVQWNLPLVVTRGPKTVGLIIQVAGIS